MKKHIFLIFALVLAAMTLLAGCGSSATTTTPAAPATSSQPTAAAPIELKLAHAYPPPSALGQIWELFAKKISDDTGGRVKITVYGAGSLIKAEEFYEATASGVTDLAYGNYNGDMNHFALDTALGLPGLGWKASWPDNVNTRLKILQELRAKYPEVAKAQQEVEIIGDVIMPGFIFETSKEVVVTPADIEGLHVAATGFYITMADVLNCSPVALGAPDRYLAFEKGTIDGSWDVYGGILAMKLYEVTNHYLEGDFGDSSGVLVMNKAKFNSLPADIQKAFKDNYQWLSDNWLKLMMAENAAGRKVATGDGAKVTPLTSAQISAWQTALQPLQTAWVNEQKNRGLPASQFLQDVLDKIKNN